MYVLDKGYLLIMKKKTSIESIILILEKFISLEIFLLMSNI